ncbi:hypothetical protein GKR50_10310 [Providencia rustigianii]|uniref:hypothetical protein n=1 Tax=Providencia rustigianii TaxID=158850 RepID=UPI000F6C664C|nr:hypothetical protein [Providencia rustigianii]MTC60410.1 hypothetical protein [Providencia rustigianii]VEH55078.1 Uncharacterised protein [Providencia rustigianii]
MSSLIFYTDDEQAIIATDTLAVTPEGKPYFFVNKATYVPTLNMVVSGLGLGTLSSEWQNKVSHGFIYMDMDHLNKHASKYLLEIYKEHQNKYGFGDNESATIYHIGYSAEEGGYAAYAFRSSNNFQCERLPHGTVAKPECDILEGNTFDLIPTMMQQQRSIQMSMPKDQRVYIGGEVFAIHLTNGQAVYYRLAEFEDYRQMQRQIFG